MGDKQRVHVIITGKVQMVFFRMETQKAALNYGICGWVKNRADGAVEAVFEGDSDQIEKTIKWCWKGSPRSVVQDVTVDQEAYTGEYSDFTITY
jgi:acylphosphatase